MKRLLGICLTLILLPFAHAEYRALTDTQGRIIEAKLIRYDIRNDSVLVQRKGQRSSMTVPLKIFCDADQKYIRNWSLNQAFLNDRTFALDCKRIKKKSESVGYGGNMATTYYDHCFNLVLENKSTTNFEDLSIEYVVYYSQEQHIKRNTEKEEREGILCGKATASIPMRSEKEVKTELVTLKSYRESGYDEAWPDLDGEIKGVIFKLTLPTEGDAPVVREFRYPKGFDSPWAAKDNNVMPRLD